MIQAQARSPHPSLVGERESREGSLHQSSFGGAAVEGGKEARLGQPATALAACFVCGGTGATSQGATPLWACFLLSKIKLLPRGSHLVG